MSAQVSGEAEGVTLLEAINAGRVPTPGELTFPQWQAWRRDVRRRPTVRVDGRGIRTRDEVALWREVMAALYGEGRADELASGDEGEQEALAVRGVSPPEPYSPESPPGSAEEGRGASPRPSSAGSGGGASVVSLRGKLDALYDPTAEDFGTYLMRMGRVINALNSLDAQVPAGMLEKVTRKAELVIELHAEFGELSKGRGVKFLRDKFVAIVQDETLDPTEKELSVQALGEIIEKLGGRLSSSPDKLFSTPSDDRNDANGQKGTGSAPPTKSGVQERQKGPGDSPMQARLAALEMELEALKQEKTGSEAGSVASGQDHGLAAALEEQTKVLKEALAGRGKDSSITSVKTDLHWPTLGDDRADSRDVSQFYEEFEDVCGLANSCRGMGHREMLLALRARCRGSRLKT